MRRSEDSERRGRAGARSRLLSATCLLLASFGWPALSWTQQTEQQHGQEGMRHHTGHHRFEDAEQWSRRFDDPARDAWQRPQEVVDLMELEAGMTVVDLGAGTGYFLGHLASAVGPTGAVRGLDVEPSMVEFMRERAVREGWSRVTAQRVEPDDPRLEPETADRILVVNTWHHIADRGAYSAKLRRGLKPGGWVVVVDFDVDSSQGPPRSQKLPPERVAEELEAGGLQPTVLEESLPEQYVVVGRRP